MVDRDGELTCPAGQMGVSRDLKARLLLACAAPTAPTPPRPPSPDWFCPRCAGAMFARSPGIEKHCATCGLVLDRAVVHALVEFHPHSLSTQPVAGHWTRLPGRPD